MMARRMVGRGLLGSTLGLAAAACSPLKLLGTANSVFPGDGGVRRIVSGAAFGSDPRQRLDVWAPASRTAPLPVVMFFYGGSWSSGRRQDYAFAAKALASRGFVVVIPDYRLVPQVRWPGFVEDAAAAVAWTLANIAGHGGDPSNVALSGHSAGAHIAMSVALDTRWLGAVKVDPARIRRVVTLAGPFDFAPFTGPATRAAFGHVPDARETQPVTYARADAPPVLLLSGDADTTVYPRNSLRLAAALKAAGSTAEVKLYPGVSHIGILLALSKPFRGKADVLGDMLGFLRG